MTMLKPGQTIKDLPRQDCTLELETATDFGKLQMGEIGVPNKGKGQEALLLMTVAKIIKEGRPACVIILPPGMAKFDASDKETFTENLKRLSELRPIIIVTGGK